MCPILLYVLVPAFLLLKKMQLYQHQPARLEHKKNLERCSSQVRAESIAGGFCDHA
jgi:hypothetical protein